MEGRASQPAPALLLDCFAQIDPVRMTDGPTITVPYPRLQIEFAAALAVIRARDLQDALIATVLTLTVPDIDRELALYVPPHILTTLAGHGLRGEMVFPVPAMLTANPRLLASYRLLYGYSKKEFYTAATGIGRFSAMEDRGVLRPAVAPHIPSLCRALCDAGSHLLAGIGAAKISTVLLDDLTLLTVGPRLRGGAHVKKGAAGIRIVFNAIQEIAQGSVIAVEETRIEVKNAAGRTVPIEFAADPDIIIREEMRRGHFSRRVAIEVKAGSDFSNIHNRIGEAEKSHQKAKADGFVECWTVIAVDNFDRIMAHRESPSTNRFYLISALVSATGNDYQDFKDRILSMVGIAA
jgi:hypothetical protein